MPFTEKELAAQFEDAVRVITELDKQAQDGHAHIDLSGLTWCYPAFILPVAAKIKQLRAADVRVDVKLPSILRIATYLKAIGFPDGRPATTRKSTYVPIIELPRPRDERVLGNIYNLCEPGLGSKASSTNAAYYVLGEMMDNIYNHARCQTGMLFAQRYPKKRCADICLLDDGIGILRSLQEKGINYTDEADAMLKACMGIPIPERGRGIPSSIKVVTEGLRGEILFASGNVYAAATPDGPTIKVYKYPNILWNGTVVCMRLPLPLRRVPDEEFYRYVEG